MCLKSNVQHNSMAKSSSIEGVPLTKLSSKKAQIQMVMARLEFNLN